jgi:uncharacterized repeat protein (TIGR01451 family)
VICTSATPNPATVGGNLAYTFTVTNNGPGPATGAVFRNQLPSGLTFVSVSTSQGSTVEKNGLVGAAFGNLANGASAQVTIVTKPTTTGNITNTASAVSTAPDTLTSNNFVSIIVPVNASTTPGVGGPTITNLKRSGFHNQPTTLVLTFDAALNASTAQNASNYTLTTAGPDGRFGTSDDVTVPIKSVVYDSGAHTVTLTPKRMIPLTTPARLVVNGTAPNGITDTFGVLLDGDNNGTPGGNYVATFEGLGSGPKGPQGGLSNDLLVAAANFRPRPINTLIMDHVESLNPPPGKSQRTQP